MGETFKWISQSKDSKAQPTKKQLWKGVTITAQVDLSNLSLALQPHDDIDNKTICYKQNASVQIQNATQVKRHMRLENKGTTKEYHKTKK